MITVTNNGVQQINAALLALDREIRNVNNGIAKIQKLVDGIDTSGSVLSVNGKTGIVTLDASDVGALPDTTHIPTDPVQSNWTETDTSSLAYIKNKPSLANVATSGSYNDLSNKPTIPSVVDTVADGNSNAVTSNAVYDKTLPLMGPRVIESACTSTELCNYIVNNGVATACCSSARITDGPNGNMWYNFLYIPHRNGIGADNYQYGTLLLFEMTSNSTWTWVKHLIDGTWYEWKTLIQG